jgi:hypothetical protein
MGVKNQGAKFEVDVYYEHLLSIRDRVPTFKRDDTESATNV